MPPPRTLGRRARRCSLSVALATVLLTLPLSSAPADAGEPEWIPPVGGRVVAPFREPISRYGVGHRGVDFAAASGTAVRAANDGRVSFAGDVAGSLHVVVAHDDGIRTSYSFLSRVDASVGQQVRKGQIVGAAGGTGEGHGPGVLHFGVRIGERYVDPMLLFRPPDLTEIVRLVPADERAVADHKTPDQEASGLAPFFGQPKGEGDDNCAGGIPLAEQFCDAGEEVIGAGETVAEAVGGAAGWTFEQVEAALDLGLRGLRAVDQFGRGVVERFGGALNDLLIGLKDAAIAVARFVLDHTPLGLLLKAVVALGAALAEKLFACAQPPSRVNPKRSDHLVIAVGGLGSSRRRHRKGVDRGQPGASFNLDLQTVGYRKSNVTYFSYSATSATYGPEETTGDLHKKARLLGEQIKTAGTARPGQPVDLAGHSQGGVVIALFLTEVYRGHESEYPPIRNVTTFAAPLQGTPTANMAQAVRGSGWFDAPPSPVRDRFNLDARSLEQLAEESPTITNLWRGRLPSGIRFLSIGGMEDPVVPSPSTEAGGGGRSIVVQAGAAFVPDDHSAILSDDDALSAAQAHVSGRDPASCGPLAGALGEAYRWVVRAAADATEAVPDPGHVEPSLTAPPTR